MPKHRDYLKYAKPSWAILIALFVSSCSNGPSQEPTSQVSKSSEIATTDRERIEDLTKIKSSLSAYKKANGTYPISEGFDGLYSNWGNSSKNWIKGLAPDYIDYLPGDPRETDTPEQQYLYKSDGTDFKLIAHYPENCEAVKNSAPEMVDPTRVCWAIGFWSQGAADW